MTPRAAPGDSRDVLPLTAAPTKAPLRVVAIEGGRGFQHRLIGMGLNVGSVLTVMHGTGGGIGPTLVAVGDTRLAIGHGMAEKILVARV